VIQVSAIVQGLPAVHRALALVGGQVDAAAEQGMARAVAGGASIVRGHASGRPGPRNITGDFRRTITGQSERHGNLVVGQIGTNAAQAARLEYGFMGRRDVLGRLFHQPPYPYMGPSEPEVRALAVREIEAAVKERLK